jgi:DNA-binding transcriptional regulator YiaG
MPEAAKMRPINLCFKPDTPENVINRARKEFAKFILSEDDQLVDYFGTDAHKTIAKRMTPAKAIRHLRHATRMTLQQVGDKIGVSMERVNDYEAGRRTPQQGKSEAIERVISYSDGSFCLISSLVTVIRN